MPATKWNTTCVCNLSDDDLIDLPESCEGFGIDQLEIEFRSEGYYLPASMYGGSDHMGWPAEGDDERTLIRVIASRGDAVVPLTPVQQQELYVRFETQVNAEPLDDDGDDDWR